MIINNHHIAVNAEQLLTRELAQEMANRWVDAGVRHLVIDLSHVQFMGRSFADEFYKQKLKLAEQNLFVEVVNASDEVFAMLKTVAATQHRPNRPAFELKPMIFNSAEEFNRFLASF